MFFYLLSTNWTALLSGTLRRYDKTGCEDDTLGLTCPQGTSISVELAQYGADPHLASNLCPRPPPGAQSNHLGYKPCHPPTSLQVCIDNIFVLSNQKYGMILDGGDGYSSP